MHVLFTEIVNIGNGTYSKENLVFDMFVFERPLYSQVEMSRLFNIYVENSENIKM